LLLLSPLLFRLVIPKSSAFAFALAVALAFAAAFAFAVALAPAHHPNKEAAQPKR
jgi:hypothetical protein